MTPFLYPGRFSTRLVLGLVVLIVVTTLSAGVPAYWLTRSQLEQQAWSHVHNTRQATTSLLQAEQTQLLDLATLFTQRPTLQRLLQGNDFFGLSPYITNFEAQSALDVLLVCGPDSRPLAGDALWPACPEPPTAGFEVVNGRPILLVSQMVRHDRTEAWIGTAVLGIWLDEPFLRQIAADTGVAQTILSPEGQRLVSSLSDVAGSVEDETPTAVSSDNRAIRLDGRRYYAAAFPLAGGNGQETLWAEVALPVDDLIATENRALSILAASTGVVTVLGVILGVWYVRQLSAPLQQLTDVADQISGGDLVAPIPQLAGPVEVTTLAAALEKSQSAMLLALEERSQARDWLNNLIQSIVEGVITFDSNGRVTFMSQGAESLIGWHRDEALGRPVNDLLPLADGRNGTFLDHTPPPGSKRQVEVVTRSGRTIVLSVTGARLVPPDSHIVQVALVLRDVTEEAAESHLRSYFLANISHEFLTPLSTLNASIELMLNEGEALSAAEMRQLLKPTYISLVGLQTLINNLLESSRIEAGRFVIHRQAINLNQAINDALRIVQPLFERRRQSFSLVEPARFPTLYADPARLTQVFVNLLTNASKYSPPGTAVDLLIEQADDHLRLSVADRGPGIAPAERDNLFRRFVRLDADSSEQYGIGLGLYVVKTTIEAHGGRVGVDERPGGGSVFWIELPLDEAKDEG